MDNTNAQDRAGGTVGDFVIDQGFDRYSDADHHTWKTLFDRQAHLLPGRACQAFLDGMTGLAIAADGIPDFRRLSDALLPRTGWQIVAVPGLVPDDVFFDHLANRRFPATNWIRRPEDLDYIEEPDVFHDVFGHVPMLMHPVFADYMQAYGAGGLRALGRGDLDKLARIYWYTVEFGLWQADGRIEIYGAGIVSSATETIFALEDPSPNRVRFNLERVMRTKYRIDDFQETYFVIDGAEDLLRLAEIDFGPIYDRLAFATDIDPGDLQPGDTVIHRGTGTHHAATPTR